MFNNKLTEDSGLTDAIDGALSELKGHEAHTEQYAQVVDQITKLYAIKDNNKPDRISKNTLVTVLGNLVGIIVIVKHEETAVLVSKALPFIGKFKTN